MWLHRATTYLLRKPWQTLGITFVISYLPVVGVSGITIAALITIRKSITEGAILTLAATAGSVLNVFFPGMNAVFSPVVIWIIIGVLLLSNLLTWLFAVMTYRNASFSLILQVACLMGVLIISVVHLVYPDVATWWGGVLQAFYDRSVALNNIVQPDPALNAQFIAISKQFATGFMVAGVLCNSLLQLLMARWWEAVVYQPGALRKDLHKIRLAPMAGWLFVISVGLMYWGNVVVLDMMPVVYLLFIVAGLSVIHFMFGKLTSGQAWVGLAVFYLIVLISIRVNVMLLSAIMMLLSLIALADIWFDLRKRFTKV